MNWLCNLFVFVILVPGNAQLLASYKLAIQWPELAIQWPDSFCFDNGHYVLPIPQEFKIHGLFGIDNNGHQLTCPTWPPVTQAQATSLNYLLPMMSIQWPNLIGDNMRFWSYEWGKHASCFNIQPYVYFSLALFLKQQIEWNIRANIQVPGPRPELQITDPIQAALLLAGVAPNDLFYPPYRFAGAINSFAGGIVQIKCNFGASMINQMVEIHFCAKISGELMSCNPNVFIDCDHFVRFTTDQNPIISNQSEALAPVDGINAKVSRSSSITVTNLP